MQHLLGLDISTTGAKALLIDTNGAVVASHTVPQSVSTPQPLWSEQDPADWWENMVQAVQAVLGRTGLADSVMAIGITGQMHGLVCLDKTGEVLRPAILWNDQRTGAEVETITAKIGAQRLIELTGNQALTGFTAPKLLWVRKHEPKVYEQIAHILLPKDYIRFRLIGDYATDLAGAAGTLLLNVAERRWSHEVLAALEIPDDWMPRTHEGTAVTGKVSQAAAEATGLPAGIPVVGGGGDQAAQAVGVGAVEPGIVALTVGTSGVVFAPLASYAYEPEGRLHAFCHAAPGLWHFMGVMLSAAGSLQWYRDALAPGADFDVLVNEAASIAPGAEGLQFLPYLTGERAPHPDPVARGAFVGLTARHRRGHMTRAVLEGVAFGLRDSFELIRQSEAGREIKQVRVSGGGARSALWRQIMANTIGVPLITVDALEGAAYGAALLAGVGAGIWPDSRAAASAVRLGVETLPENDRSAYEAAYQVYRSLYPALKDAFAALAGH
ncbi:MAG: xylulokinase [Chloroflexi bacterium]|nr:xylulokinase [Chloroflexota bacterium]